MNTAYPMTSQLHGLLIAVSERTATLLCMAKMKNIEFSWLIVSIRLYRAIFPRNILFLSDSVCLSVCLSLAFDCSLICSQLCRTTNCTPMMRQQFVVIHIESIIMRRNRLDPIMRSACTRIMINGKFFDASRRQAIEAMCTLKQNERRLLPIFVHYDDTNDSD
jgi:hypothetical protein